jgi:parallel beta-helix repeat protein
MRTEKRRIFVPLFDIYNLPGYYVSVLGNDGNPGTFFKPFRTLTYAATRLVAGDTLWIRGGVYQEESAVWFDEDGTEESPINIRGYPGEVAVVDGDVWTIAMGGCLVNVAGNWNNISNLEIRYGDRNLTILGDYCSGKNIYAHHSWSNGIVFSGSYGLLEYCRASNNTLVNEYPLEAPWGFGISACRYPTGTTIRHCTSWLSWGEGISTFESYDTTIEDCISYNNMCNFYLSDTQNCLFQRNIAWHTLDSPLIGHYTLVNILAADEGHTPSSNHNTLINNICTGGNRSFYMTKQPYCLISNNTIYNAFDGATNMNLLFGYDGVYSDYIFRNNIVSQAGEGRLVDDGFTGGVTIDHNLWSSTPPAICQGDGDVIGDPLLIGTGSPYVSDFYKLQSISPAISAGSVVSVVTTDFAGITRPVPPSIGAYEYI